MMGTTSEDNITTDSNLLGKGNILIPAANLPKLYSAGMPTDQQMRRYVVAAGIDFGNHYNDFIIEFFGTEGTWPDSAGTKQRVAAKWTIHSGTKPELESKPAEILKYGYSDGREFVINIWRQRIFFRDAQRTTPYIEKLWFAPSAKWITTIENIQDRLEPRTAVLIKRLADGLPLLFLSFENRTISGYTQQEIEEMISGAVEKMAQAEPDKSRPRRFKVARFAAHWPVATSRTNIYNYVNKERLAANAEIDNRYKARCNELASEQ
jgi:hypothetical protein